MWKQLIKHINPLILSTATAVPRTTNELRHPSSKTDVLEGCQLSEFIGNLCKMIHSVVHPARTFAAYGTMQISNGRKGKDGKGASLRALACATSFSHGDILLTHADRLRPHRKDSCIRTTHQLGQKED